MKNIMKSKFAKISIIVLLVILSAMIVYTINAATTSRITNWNIPLITDQKGGAIRITVSNPDIETIRAKVIIEDSQGNDVSSRFFAQESIFMGRDEIFYILVTIPGEYQITPGTYSLTVLFRDEDEDIWEEKETRTFEVSPYVTSVSLDKRDLQLIVRDEVILEATVLPEDATNKKVTWTSENTSVASVDQNGKVTAVGTGITAITVTTEVGNRTATCYVSVRDPGRLEIRGITIDPDPLYDRTGGEVIIEINNPEAGIGIGWTILQNNVNVSANFNIEIKKSEDNEYGLDLHIEVPPETAYGNYEVGILAIDGMGSEIIGRRSFTVLANVTGIEIEPKTLEVKQGKTENITATVFPTEGVGAANKNVIWSSNSPGVAMVENGKVTGLEVGTAVITARTQEGNFSETCVVTVVLDPGDLSIETTTIPDPLYDTEGGIVNIKVNDPNAGLLTYMIRDSSNTLIKEFVTSMSEIDNFKREITIEIPVDTKAGRYSVEISSNNLYTGSTTTLGTATFDVLASVTDVTLNKDVLELVPGAKETLIATIEPANAANKNVTWGSNNMSVATVSATGEVTAVSRGTATVTVRTEDGAKTATCTVRVKEVDLEIDSVDNPTVYDRLGGTVTVNVSTVDIDNGDELDIVIKDSEDTDVTEMFEIDGNIVMNDGAHIEIIVPERTNFGTYTVEVSYVKENIADITKTATFNISEYILVTGISLDETSIELGKGETFKLIATVLPVEATNRKVNWTSSNTGVATVDEYGLVTGVSKGTAVITATTQEGNKSATCAIRVRDISIVIEPFANDPINSKEGGTITIPVTTEDIDNGSALGIIIKDSYNDIVSNFIVTGTTVNDNSANIVITVPPNTRDDRYTVEISYRNVTETVDFIVGEFIPVTGISVSPDNIFLRAENTETITAIISPSNATNKELVWSSDDEDIATVDEYGIVTGVSKGTTIITVVTVDGGYEAICEVTVENPTMIVGDLILNPSPIYDEIGGTITIPISGSDIINGSNIGIKITNSNAQDVTGQFTISGNTILNDEATVVITVPAKMNYGVYTVEISVNSVVRTKTFNILEFIHVTSIKLNKSIITIKKGDTYQLIETIEPPEAVNKNVRWNSADTNIVRVDSNGLLTGIGKGTAVVTATTEDGNIRASCTVTVTEPTILPDVIEINTTIYTGYGGIIVIPVKTLGINDNETLNVKIKNDSGQDVGGTFQITGNKVENSEANIIITVPTIALNGVYEVELSYANAVTKTVVFYIVLRVEPPAYVGVDEIILNKASIIMEKGKTETIVATIEPYNATEQTLIWSSNNPGIASVTQNGVITGVAAGLTKIVVTTENGFKMAECAIKVKENVAEKVEQTFQTTEEGGEKFITSISEKTKVEDMSGLLNLEDYIIEFKNIKQEILNNNNFVGTGSTMKIMDEEKGLMKEYTIIVKGDVGGDGLITATDLAKVRRHMAGIELLKGVFKKGAEMTVPGAVTATDLANIRRYLAGY